MKKSICSYLFITGVLFCAATAFAVTDDETPQKADLSGAWTSSETLGGQAVTHSLIMTDSYFSMATHATEGGAFMATLGGKYTTTANTMTVTFEFHTSDKSLVGQSVTLNLTQTKDRFSVNTSDGATSYTFENVDKGKPGDLAGAWLISGRKGEDGEVTKRNTDVPRKTMKILSGTRFQWIAYNTETGEFFGTGGGTYTTKGGKYTENIGFFSRDNSRVGAKLEFDYEVKDGDWHHSGLSSKGDPIYEVWSKR